MAVVLEGLPLLGKTKKKTNVFWSTVPENEQFRNVRVPGVAVEAFRSDEMNSIQQPRIQTVRRSKSDSAVPSSRDDPLTSGKNTRKVNKISEKQKESSIKNTDVLKGTTIPSTQADSMLSSSGGISRRASIKNLNVEDKKRVANLIKELAKTGEERELALERLQEERVSFEERLCAVQEEQASLRLERESLRQKLKEGQALLKKYETELQDVKRQKQKQDHILKKQSVALAQGTQTSPSQKKQSDSSTLAAESRSVGLSVEYNGEADQTKTTDSKDYAHSSTLHNAKHLPIKQMSSEVSQVPVYSNSLFDLKMSKVEQPVPSSANPVDGVELLNGKHGHPTAGDDAGLHELYLREYKLQLRLQEQQLEIQRQQLLFQQHLHLLTQQQQQTQQKQVQLQHSPQSSPGHINQQEPLTEEQSGVSHHHPIPFPQQQSHDNQFQQFGAKYEHTPRSDEIRQDLKDDQSQIKQKKDMSRVSQMRGFPSQRYHYHRDPKHGENMQSNSYNPQATETWEFHKQCNQLNDNYHNKCHYSTAKHPHLSEQHVTEQYHQPAKLPSQPKEQPCHNAEDYHLHEQHQHPSEQHGHLLEPKHLREKHPTVSELYHSGIEHHYPVQPPRLQNEQGHSHPDKHFYPVEKHHRDPYGEGYHHQNLGEDNFCSGKNLDPVESGYFSKLCRSPMEQHFQEQPYTIEESFYPGEKRGLSLKAHQHTSEQCQHQAVLSPHVADRHQIIRKYSLNPAEQLSHHSNSAFNQVPSLQAGNPTHLTRDPRYLRNDDTSGYLISSDHPTKARQDHLCTDWECNPWQPQINSGNSEAQLPLDTHTSNRQISTKYNPFPKPIYHTQNIETNNPAASKKKTYPRQASEDKRELVRLYRYITLIDEN